MPRRKGRSLTREDVIAAAIACVDAEGEKALGVNRVARQLGIKPPSLYNHIEGNDDLRRAVALAGWRELLVGHRLLATKAKGLPLLKDLARSFRQFSKDRPGLYAVTISTHLERQDPEFEPIVEELISLYSGALKPYGLSDDDVINYVIMTRAALQGFIGMEAMDHIRPKELTEGSFSFLLDTLTKAAYRDGLAEGTD